MGRSNHRHPGPPTPPLPGQDSRATLCSMLRGDWQGPQAGGEGSPVQSSLGGSQQRWREEGEEEGHIQHCGRVK